MHLLRWSPGCVASAHNFANKSSCSRFSAPTHLSTTYHLGPLVYSSKVEVQRESRRILKRTDAGQQIKPGDDDFEYLWHLWQHHRSAHVYADRGISHFSAEVNTDFTFKTKCFVVHFADGCSRDGCSRDGCSRDGYSRDGYSREFSYMKCLENRQHKETILNGGWTGPAAPRTAAQLAQANKQAAEFGKSLKKQQAQFDQLLPDNLYFQAMRGAVEDQVLGFRSDALRGHALCPLSGVVLTGERDCHVDHFDTPFAVLADQWLHQEGLQLTDTDNWTPEQKSSWQKYHARHAKLRLLSKDAYMRLSHEANLARAAAKAKAAAAAAAAAATPKRRRRKPPRVSEE